jgi:hypothetical protein
MCSTEGNVKDTKEFFFSFSDPDLDQRHAFQKAYLEDQLELNSSSKKSQIEKKNYFGPRSEVLYWIRILNGQIISDQSGSDYNTDLSIITTKKTSTL